MFKTKKGIYQLDTETGLFTVKERPSTPKRFIGSINPNWIIGKNSSGGPLVLEDIVPAYRAAAVLVQLSDGKAAGFSPQFIVGYRPFGMACEAKVILSVGEQKVNFSEEGVRKLHDLSLKLELGSKIEEVYRQLRDEEREYEIRR